MEGFALAIKAHGSGGHGFQPPDRPGRRHDPAWNETGEMIDVKGENPKRMAGG